MKTFYLRFFCILIALVISLTAFSACINDSEKDNTVEATYNNETTHVDNDPNIKESDQPTNAPTETEEETNCTLQIFNIDAFSNGLARIFTNTGYGYIDTKGNVVIEPIYETADELANELIFVTVNDEQYFINLKGEIKFTATGDEIKISSFKNGYFYTQTKREALSGAIHTLSYYDKNGNKAFEIENCSAIEDLSDINEFGYAIVDIKGGGASLEIIDSKGQVHEFDNQDGILKQYLHNHYFYFPSKERYLIDYENHTFVELSKTPTSMHGAFYFVGNGIIYNGLDLVLDLSVIDEIQGAQGYKIDISKVKNTYYATVFMQSKSNVFFSSIVDSNGNVIISPTKDIKLAKEITVKIEGYGGAYLSKKEYVPYTFHGNLCLAEDVETGLFGYVGTNGQWAIAATYSSATDFCLTGNTAIAVVNENTVIDSNGKIIFTIDDINY